MKMLKYDDYNSNISENTTVLIEKYILYKILSYIMPWWYPLYLDWGKG